MILRTLNTQFKQEVENLFQNYSFLDNKNIVLKGTLPSAIIDEIDSFTECCNDIRSNELYFLKNHQNVGMNSFQVSVPTRILEESFLFPYLLHAAEYYYNKLGHSTPMPRAFRLRKNECHYDGYDFWINYIHKGNINKWHNHAGFISGVIYIDNEIGLTTDFEDGTSYCGSRGDIVLFPSYFRHKVEENTTDKARITYAFNIDYLGDMNE